jgi:aryl-alcohol dehydrogenase-like predicted oxidoreductase
MPQLALRFILSNPNVSTIIPGMRKLSHVDSNIAVSDAGPLSTETVNELRSHRWERKPATWSN